MIILISSASAEEIYRCQKGSTVFFQSTPCDASYEQKLIDKSAMPEASPTAPMHSGSSEQDYLKSLKKEIVLKREVDSHFYINGRINGVDVLFLIDTGASVVAIPVEIAKAAGLTDEDEVETGTSSGMVKSNLTTLSELEIGEFKFKNVQGVIVTGSKALLGMNVLQFFEMQQKDNQLTLVYKGT